MEANNKLREVCEQMLTFISNLEIEPYSALDEAASELRDKISAALSAPPRNCDVGTAEEQKKRLNEFCCSHGTDIQGAPRCENCALLYADRCELTWAQMPYESEVER